MVASRQNNRDIEGIQEFDRIEVFVEVAVIGEVADVDYEIGAMRGGGIDKALEENEILMGIAKDDKRKVIPAGKLFLHLSGQGHVSCACHAMEVFFQRPAVRMLGADIPELRACDDKSRCSKKGDRRRSQCFFSKPHRSSQGGKNQQPQSISKAAH